MICKCGKDKVSFPDEAAADAALLNAKIARALHGSQKRRECRTYRCPANGGWHLTSKPLLTTNTGGTAA